MAHFQRIDSVFIPVTDVEKSAKWYEDVLGFILELRDTTWKYYSMRMTAEEGNSTPWFTLYEVKEVQPAAHMPFNLYAPDGASIHQRLKEQGVRVTDIINTGSMLVFEVFDPDDNRIGIIT
jgi:catechol 2,3-dioxygenase-like lactoylglutathione lyase family enzyme